MITVEKIGGTSMLKFPEIFKNIFCQKRENDGYYNRIFVVSAYSGVSDILLKNKRTGEEGIFEKFKQFLNLEDDFLNLKKLFFKINKSLKSVNLDVENSNHFISKRINALEIYIKRSKDILHSGYIDKTSIFLGVRELLASIGEVHSAYNTANILNRNGIKATFIDLTGFENINSLKIGEIIKNKLQGINFSVEIPILTGYAKDEQGIMSIYNRGYTEITFALTASLLKADEAIIHKEYHLSSADPEIVGEDESIPVCFTNYGIADQMADVGMVAIHPKAAKILENSNINLRIKNSFQNNHPGTLITKKFKNISHRIELVTGTDKTLAVEITDSRMVSTAGFDLGFMELYFKYNISYILKSTSANSITTVIWENVLNDTLSNELNEKYEKVMVREVALVNIIGTNININDAITKATNILSINNIDILGMSLSLNRVNIQFIIQRENYKKAIKVLNKNLCLKN